jgi:hypothetical protein
MRLLAAFALALTVTSTQTGRPPARLDLELLPGRLAICRLDPKAEVPRWADKGNFTTITRTKEEISVVCPEANIPRGTKCETGRRAFRISGTVDFALIGIIASLANPLAQAGVSIFVISTYDTDYLLVAEDTLDKATGALEAAGHRVRRL